MSIIAKTEEKDEQYFKIDRFYNSQTGHIFQN